MTPPERIVDNKDSIQKLLAENKIATLVCIVCETYACMIYWRIGQPHRSPHTEQGIYDIPWKFETRMSFPFSFHQPVQVPNSLYGPML
jgi:hypothetical protein